MGELSKEEELHLDKPPHPISSHLISAFVLPAASSSPLTHDPNPSSPLLLYELHIGGQEGLLL